MKRTVVLVLLSLLLPPLVHAQYGQFVGVANATVSGTIVGGTGSSAVLTITLNTNPGGQIPVLINSLNGFLAIGFACPNGFLPFGHGCYTAPGATTLKVLLSAPAVAAETLIIFNVAVEYDDSGINVPVKVEPQGSGAVCTTCRPPCPGCQASMPINLSDGNTWIQQSDIRQLPGLGNGIQLMRTWNSRWPAELAPAAAGMFGPHWRSTYEERVFIGSDSLLKYARGDGALWSFGYSNSAWVAISPANPNAKIVNGGSGWTLTMPDGEQRQFDNVSGNLLAIIDRNGNTTQISYDSAGRVATITDPASRHLNFTYASPSSLLVTTASSDAGYTVSYAYDASGRLTQVTESDGSKLLFEYDAQSLISAVKDMNGKLLEAHTYDSNGRGLTSSRAGGVGAITVTYPVSQ